MKGESPGPESLVTGNPSPIPCSFFYSGWPAEDLALSDYHISGDAAQTEFLAHYMGQDESIFEDAEAFKPERWLRNKDTAFTEAAEAFASIPFWFQIFPDWCGR